MLSHLFANANNKIIVKPLFYLITTGLTAPPNITATIILNTTSFNVTWTMTVNDNYTVTWTNLRTGTMNNMTVVDNTTTSYMVTNLSGMDNYNVTVTANYLYESATSNPNTVYGMLNLLINTYLCIHVHTFVSWQF